MDMQGSRQLAVTREQAWEALNDPEILKRCITGCEKFELVGENTYAIVVAIRIGPVSARFNGKVTLADIVVPESYALRFDAQGGAAGFGKGESQVQLVPNDQGVELRYTVKSTVGGKLAQIGQRLIDGVAKSLAEEFFSRFEAELVKRNAQAMADSPPAPQPAESDAAASAGTAAAAAVQAGSSSAPATPTGTPSWVWWGAIIAAFVAGWLLGR
jgi:carbon monoxide dehydrogenase subunit G